MDNVEFSASCALPDEIWYNIFKNYMSSKDRKSVRMTCKRWQDCCNHGGILKKEKLHLPGISHLTDIVSTLLTSDRSILNLKFANHRFEGTDLPLWTHCGPNIQRLELENCAITLESMKEILIWCTTLSYLDLRNVQIVNDGEMGRFGKTFFRISEMGLMCRSVKTLVLDIYELLSDDELEFLVSTFPALTDLEFDFHHLSHLTSDLREPELHQLEYYDEDEVPYSCQEFAKCLARNLLQLERLVVKTPSSQCKCDLHVRETTFCSLKMAEFHNNQVCKQVAVYVPRIYSFSTSSHFENVTYAEICCLPKINAITKVLRELTGLRKIKMKPSIVNCFNDAFEFYEALAYSKLESMKFDNSYDFLLSFESVYNVLSEKNLLPPVNVTVKELKLVTKCHCCDFVSLFLKCFPAVTRFRLQIMSTRATSIGNIFSQRSLKCVQIKSFSRRPGILLCPGPSNLERVTPNLFVDNLEYLQIEINMLKELLVEQPSIMFPKLRYLHISSPTKLPLAINFMMKPYSLKPSEIRCFPLENLAGVYMDVSINDDDIYTFFSNPYNFPRIQYIGIRVAKPGYVQYKTFFESWFDLCPCLTTIIVLYLNTGVCLYFDPVRGEVRECGPEIYNSRNPGLPMSVRNPYATLNTGITLFHYFRNLKSFFNFYKNNC